MRLQDSSSGAEDQFFLDVSAFLVEFVPNTGIKLLRARPETEPALSRQLAIPYRLDLLRKSAERTTGPSPEPPTAAALKDAPASGSSQTDTLFLQDVAPVGQTGAGETVYLALSIVVQPSQWRGGWFIGLVTPGATEVWQAHLTSAREAIVAQLQPNARRSREKNFRLKEIVCLRISWEGSSDFCPMIMKIQRILECL
jgi:hypothetical protein